MKLISPDVVSKDEYEIQQLLQKYPSLMKHITILVNQYRDLVYLYMEGEDLDSSDVQRSLLKKESAMKRLGIPILETADDWRAARFENGKHGEAEKNL